MGGNLSLDVHFVEEFYPAAGMAFLPLVVCVSSGVDVVVSERIELVELMLVERGGEREFGFVSSGRIGRIRELMELTPSRPWCRVFDLLEDSEGRVLSEGVFVLSVRVSVFVPEKGEFRMVELRAEREVVVSK